MSGKVNDKPEQALSFRMDALKCTFELPHVFLKRRTTSEKFLGNREAFKSVLGRQLQNHENGTSPGFVEDFAFQDLLSFGQEFRQLFPGSNQKHETRS